MKNWEAGEGALHNEGLHHLLMRKMGLRKHVSMHLGALRA
jgi:hypothetical protein